MRRCTCAKFKGTSATELPFRTESLLDQAGEIQLLDYALPAPSILGPVDALHPQTVVGFRAPGLPVIIT